jgi:hypothetical protein
LPRAWQAANPSGEPKQSGRIDQSLKLDWMLPNDEFDRAVLGGLRQNFPELTDDARLLRR